jgi:hypothetical protein
LNIVTGLEKYTVQAIATEPTGFPAWALELQ